MSAAFAPCRFAFNVPERRMTLLSGKLAGLILPYYDYGSHLDDFGHTIDVELKIEFKHAGQTFVDAWGNLTTDSFPAIVEYIEPQKNQASSS